MVFGGVHVVPDNQNFVAQSSPGNGYGYRAYGELSDFVYCVLQKINRSDSLPLVELWENEMLRNHSAFAGIEAEHFLVWTRVHAALEKRLTSYLKMKFRTNARRFLEEFCSSILSTVAARSELGQGFSCFCPEINLGGDDHSNFSRMASCWMDLLNVVRRKGQKLRLVKPSSSLSSGSRTNRSVIPQESALI